MKSLADLETIKKNNIDRVIIGKNSKQTRVVVGMATCGIAAGARPVLQAIEDEIAKKKLSDVIVTQTGCIGVCRLEPLVEVYEPGKEKVTYVKMDPDKAAEVVAEHLAGGHVLTQYTIGASEK